ncbi:MAG: hypothetical protein U1E76_11070 [Planctomycetota bacterium]
MKDYRGFVINKGVTVRATAGRFDLHGSNTIQITNVPSGRAARLSNVEMLHSYCSLEVSHCAGEVLLDDVQLGSPDQIGAYAARDRLVCQCPYQRHRRVAGSIPELRYCYSHHREFRRADDECEPHRWQERNGLQRLRWHAWRTGAHLYAIVGRHRSPEHPRR